MYQMDNEIRDLERYMKVMILKLLKLYARGNEKSIRLRDLEIRLPRGSVCTGNQRMGEFDESEIKKKNKELPRPKARDRVEILEMRGKAQVRMLVERNRGIGSSKFIGRIIYNLCEGVKEICRKYVD